eukprot:g458.t1 g458   contig10:77218-79590(+)
MRLIHSSHRRTKLYASDDINTDDIINSLLNNQNTNTPFTSNAPDPYSKYTHQIAIPLSSSSELTSVLHSIQTSLVGDCPRLIRACVMPALLRLPLLYVDGGSFRKNGGGVFDGGSEVDGIIEKVVHDAIRAVVYGEESTTDEDLVGSSSSTSGEVTMAEPILLPFRGLELQGEDNSVLYAVGYDINDKSSKKKSSTIFADDEDDDDGVIIVDDWSSPSPSSKAAKSGYETLQQLVHTIQTELQTTYGLDTVLPLDNPQGDEIEYDDPLLAAVQSKLTKDVKFRPRVPFVRLPTDFYQDLQNDARDKSKEYSDDDQDSSFLIEIEKGGDGISPLFWYEAWGDEEILPSPGVRMRSIAVYRRMVPGGGEAESSFYVPTSSSSGDSSPQAWVRNNSGTAVTPRNDESSMDLPFGDAKLTARERRENAKEMERMGDIESRAEREWEQGKARWMGQEMSDNDGDAFIDEQYSELEIGIEVGDVFVDGDDAYTSPWGERDVEKSVIEASGSSVHNEHFTAAEAEMPQQSNTEPRSKLPSIEDNPVFQRLWNGQSQKTAQGQSIAQSLDGRPSAEETPLPPYPSDEHFVGVWRVVTSPLGTESDPDEEKSSDNFIFRVDGQIMGGPILDAQYQHKAAGGSWRMFQAVRKASGNDSDTPPKAQTRLRIRLVVPPERQRAIVLEGEVTRMVMGAEDASSLSSSESWTLGSGGILDGMSPSLILENDDFSQSGSGEVLLYCGGEAWIEDNVERGGNRRKLGPFSLMKLKTPDRSKLIYTVPASKAGADPSEDESDDDDED